MDKDITTSLLCPACQTNNNLEARVCIQCGQPLAAARARLHLDRAEADINSGRYENARVHLTKADLAMLGLSNEERRSSLLTARAFWLQGLIYYHKGQTSESRAELLLARQHLEGVAGGEALMARVLNQLGNDAFYERSADAANYYLHSSEVASNAGEHAVAAQAMSNLGMLRSSDGQIEEALTWYEQALAEAERSGDPLRRADTYRLVGGLYSDQGPYTLALDYIGKALDLCGQITNISAVCRITSDAGEIYLRYRDLEQAEHWLRRSDEIALQTDYKLVYNANAVILSNLMRVKGDLAAALSYATRAHNQLNLASAERGSVTLTLTLCYVALRNWPLAKRQIQRLEEICTAQPTSEDLLNLTWGRTILYAAQGAWDGAESSLQEALSCADDLHNKYQATNLQEEYATQLLANPAARRSTAIQARATRLLTRIAATWQEMEMPLRHARVLTML